MGKKAKEAKIGGIDYRISHVGAETGDLILFKVGQAVGTAIANIVSADVSEDAMVLGLFQAIRHVSPADFRATVTALAAATQVGVRDEHGDGRVTFVRLSDVYDEHFTGEYTNLTEWLKEALQHNFADFIGGLRKRMAEAKAKGAAKA